MPFTNNPLITNQVWTIIVFSFLSKISNSKISNLFPLTLADIFTSLSVLIYLSYVLFPSLKFSKLWPNNKVRSNQFRNIIWWSNSDPIKTWYFLCNVCWKQLPQRNTWTFLQDNILATSPAQLFKSYTLTISPQHASTKLCKVIANIFQPNIYRAPNDFLRNLGCK